MAKVIGVGGVFLDFKGDKEELHEFYLKYLGLDMSDYGSGFIEGEQMMLLSFKRENKDAPLINFRVDNLEEVMQVLKVNDLSIKDIEEYEYGKFAWFTDPFGNYIELWEPNEVNYRKMVKEEINKYKSK